MDYIPTLGMRGLRTCGSVQNLLPSGATWLVYNADASIVSGDTYLLNKLGSGAYMYVSTPRTTGQTYYHAVLAKVSSGTTIGLGSGNDFLEYNLKVNFL